MNAVFNLPDARRPRARLQSPRACDISVASHGIPPAVFARSARKTPSDVVAASPARPRRAEGQIFLRFLGRYTC